VLLADDHPLSGGDEVDLADFAAARWAATPGDGCFADCFAAACARAGFTPEPMYETDLRVCLDLVTSGQAVALCQPTFREQPGVRGYPFAGAPLRWRHLLGWHPEAPADAVAAQVHEYARDRLPRLAAPQPGVRDMARRPSGVRCIRRALWPNWYVPAGPCPS
jgi:hypothetical protein